MLRSYRAESAWCMCKGVHVAELFPGKICRKEPPISSQLRHEATLISVLVMIFTLCGTRAQTVTQPEDHISVFERSPVQVKCNYSYSGSPVLFWYVQYPKQHLQLLLKHISRESIRGFTAHLDKKEASFHLKKPSAQEEDSAIYYCALSDTVTGFTREAEHKPLKSYRKCF
uniref:Immunoglobulin domain-containing protein n=1 Tax=Sus scrofa TaxID=9823 RepID=A0A4X1V0C1_PIG